jgi:hypothetical protein
MQVKRVVWGISVGVLLVLVLAVTGAFADPVTGGKHGDLVSFYQTQTFNQTWNSDFWFDNNSWSKGTKGDSWFGTWLWDGPKPDLDGGPPAPPTTTPEPASVYLLALGAGLIFLGTGRRATQP